MSDQTPLDPFKSMASFYQTRTRSPDASHPYLAAAGVREGRVRVAEADPSWPIAGPCLIVPVRNADGRAQTLLAIAADGARHTWPGLPLGGGHHLIGNTAVDGPIILTADYAVAAKFHEATGWPAIVSVEVDNLAAVADWLPGKFTGRDIIVAGEKAHRAKIDEAADMAGGIAIYPELALSGDELAADINRAIASVRTEASTPSHIEPVDDVLWQAAVDTVLVSDPVPTRGCVLSSEILEALGGEPGKRDLPGEARVVAYLRAKGWERRQCRIGGLRRNWWFPASVTDGTADEAAAAVAELVR